jgi:hypothetical protein
LLLIIIFERIFCSKKLRCCTTWHIKPSLSWLSFKNNFYWTIYLFNFFDNYSMVCIHMFFLNYYFICFIIYYKSFYFFCVWVKNMHKTIVKKQTSHDLRVSNINLLVIIDTKKSNKLHFYYDPSIFFLEHTIWRFVWFHYLPTHPHSPTYLSFTWC